MAGCQRPHKRDVCLIRKRIFDLVITGVIVINGGFYCTGSLVHGIPTFYITGDVGNNGYFEIVARISFLFKRTGAFRSQKAEAIRISATASILNEIRLIHFVAFHKNYSC